MVAKLQCSRVQAREAAAAEFSKPWYLMQPSKREMRAMVRSLDGVVVKRCPNATLRRRIKSYGNGARRGSILTPDVYAIGTWLSDRKGGADG
jgi:hypothetical protein